MRKIFALLAAGAFLCAVAKAQDDQPSLGDLARQTRAEKQQKDAAQGTASVKDAPKTQSDALTPASPQHAQPKTAHVFTDEDLSNHVTKKTTAEQAPDSKDATKDQTKDLAKESAADLSPAKREELAQQWKEQIQAQKESIAELQRQIAEVGDSIHFVGGNCVQNCEQWNENQQRKQGQVASMKDELAAEQQHLEEMQDTARKQGFGSNVSD